MIRAMTPVFTVILSIAFLQKHYPRKIYLSLLPVSTKRERVVQTLY